MSQIVAENPAPIAAPKLNANAEIKKQTVAPKPNANAEIKKQAERIQSRVERIDTAVEKLEHFLHNALETHTSSEVAELVAEQPLEVSDAADTPVFENEEDLIKWFTH